MGFNPNVPGTGIDLKSHPDLVNWVFFVVFFVCVFCHSFVRVVMCVFTFLHVRGCVHAWSFIGVSSCRHVYYDAVLWWWGAWEPSVQKSPYHLAPPLLVSVLPGGGHTEIVQALLSKGAKISSHWDQEVCVCTLFFYHRGMFFLESPFVLADEKSLMSVSLVQPGHPVIIEEARRYSSFSFSPHLHLSHL